MENVSDQDLRRLLSSKGHVIGPITNTTRSIYQKLYAKLVEEGVLVMVSSALVAVREFVRAISLVFTTNNVIFIATCLLNAIHKFFWWVFDF